MWMHPSAHRLLDALLILRKVDGHAEPGKVASPLGESPATITNWKARGVSKTGALKAAELFGVNPVWVRTGEGQMSHKPVTSIPNLGDADSGTSNVLFTGLNKRVPRLHLHEIRDYVQGMFTPPADRFETVANSEASARCFLLEVDGDAMAGPVPSESIHPGSMLLCDPDTPASAGDVVIAMHPRSGEPIVRQIIKEGGVWFLRAANPAYPMMEIESPGAVLVALALEVITRRKLKGPT